MVEYETDTQNDVDGEVSDPHCLADNPIKVNFQDITSASFMIRSGVEYTPCTVK